MQFHKNISAKLGAAGPEAGGFNLRRRWAGSSNQDDVYDADYKVVDEENDEK